MSTGSASASAGRLVRRSGGSLFLPCTIVFFSGFCIMLIELVASQLVAGYIGRSLLTWTTVIGVILAGIAMGNYIGGILADRIRSMGLVATLFILSAILCAGMLYVIDPIGEATKSWMGDQWIKRILVVVVGCFFLPATVLGMISPGIAKWALDYGYATGATVGTIYAWNTIGSIVGTFLTGFYLVNAFDVQVVVWISAAGLLLAGLAFVPSALSGATTAPRDEMSRTQVSAANNRSEWKKEGLVIPSTLVFISGFVVMLVEIVASRLVAGHIGQSVYTWTSVIGVILAGITIGNYSGGRLADIFDSKRLVGTLFLNASLACLTILFAHHMVANATQDWWTEAIGWGPRVFAVCLVAFFLPATTLGMISPAVAKWALERRYATGQTVGTIYSWNTIGSICGTFATGFYLISELYVSRLVGISSVVLAAISLLFLIPAGPWLSRILATGWIFIAGFVTIFACLPANRFEEAALAFYSPSLQSVSRKQAPDILEDLKQLTEKVGELEALVKPADLAKIEGSPIDLESRKNAFSSIHDILAEGVEPAALSRMKLKINDLKSQIDFVESGRAEKAKAAEAPKVDLPKAKKELAELVDRLNDYSPAKEISIDGPFLERNLRESKIELRRLIAHLKAQTPVNDAALQKARAAQSHISSLLNPFNVKERDWLRFATMFVARNEEINIDDQYNSTDLLQYYDESDYYTIQITETSVTSNMTDDVADSKDAGADKRRNRTVRQLVLDALIHGYVEMSDYKYLHYEYEHLYASISHRVLRAAQAKKEPLRVLFLGGGSYTFPRYLTAYYPKDEKTKTEAIACDIAEIDPRVTRSVHMAMGLNMAKDRRFVLLTDGVAKDPKYEGVTPGELRHVASPGVVAGLGKLLEIVTSIRSKAPERTEEMYIRLLDQAGAIRQTALSSEAETKTDYLLDIRTDRSTEPALAADAKKMGVKVIGPDEFKTLLETTSHENVVTHHMDARQYILQNQKKGEYDVIYGDAFNDFSVPSHLTTLEFNKSMAELLKPEGVFMANVIDIWRVSKFMGSYLNTLEQAFGNVYLLSTEEGTPGKSRSTFVIICSKKPMKLDDMGKRPEDVKGLVGSLMVGDYMKPVTRGGLFRLKDMTIAADGTQTSYDLGAKCGDLVVSMSRPVAPEEYAYYGHIKTSFFKHLTDGGTAPFTLPEGSTATVEASTKRRRRFVSPSNNENKFEIPDYVIRVPQRHGFSKLIDFKLDHEQGVQLLSKERLAPNAKIELVFGKAVDIHIDGDGVKKDHDLKALDMQVNVVQKLAEKPPKGAAAAKAPSPAWVGPTWKLVDGTKLEFSEPIPQGWTVTVRRWSDKKIILTDRYCPVDNMLAEVAATRVEVEDHGDEWLYVPDLE